MLWHCETCKALYAPELSACPQCGGTDYRLAPGGEPVGDVLSSAPTAPTAPTGKKQRAASSAPAAAAPDAATAPETAPAAGE